MKNVATCIITILLSLAYSFEMIEYFSNLTGEMSIQCEENSTGEESNEKSEKLNFSDDEYFNTRHHHKVMDDQIERCLLSCQLNIIFSSSDYSHEVYSPPEVA